MLKFKESKKKQGSFFSNLSTNYKDLIDPEKETLLLNEVSLGIGNRVVYQKFPGFVWPLWLNESGDFYSPGYRPSPGPLLLNTNFREWQTFTNYISGDEIQIDRSGMIAGPGGAAWAVEFWYSGNGIIYHPQKNPGDIQPVRDSVSGEICIAGKLGSTAFYERIAGGRSGVDEALVSYEINTPSAGDILFVVIRPYNCLKLGGINNISSDSSGLLLSINGKNCIGFENRPDVMVTGSGADGDVDCRVGGFKSSVECSYGMASSASGFNLKKGNNVINLRILLDGNRQLHAGKTEYGRLFKEFRAFSDLRLNEGLKIEIADKNMEKIFRQSRITLFNNNAGDFDPETIDGFRNLYFFSYAMNRAGLDLESERLVNGMLEKFSYNAKIPEYNRAVCASYLIGAFYECYLHKREPVFLQNFFPEIRKLGDYIYNYSTAIHSIDQLPGSVQKDRFVRQADESDFIIILSAVINVSYLSRCMGIFGDEIKFKNEAERIQSVIKNIIEKKRALSTEEFSVFRPLIAFPENIITGYKEKDYAEFFSGMSGEKNFPLFNKISGIDLFSSAMILIHLIALKDARFESFYNKFFSLIDDFFILPEFVDPETGRGIGGDGNLKISAALILVIIRNRLFLDRAERLEIFPAPERGWFEPGKKVGVEDALTRYGKITFTAETFEDEIKLTFTGLPRFIPSDIMINIPLETSIMESDDFILKRKSGNAYIINGWPSIVRFSITEKINPAL